MNPVNFAMDVINRGGPLMYPLLVCSIIMLTIIIERVFALKQLQGNPYRIICKISNFLSNGNKKEALHFLEAQSSIPPKVFEGGIRRYERDREEIETSIVNTIQEYVPIMERSVGTLGTIAVISPFLGLLGTIIGLIDAFTKIAIKGTTGPGVIATGIYEALYTTAAGLIIAIPAVIFYNYFKSRITNWVNDMEVCGNKLVEMILLSRKGKEFPLDLQCTCSIKKKDCND